MTIIDSIYAAIQPHLVQVPLLFSAKGAIVGMFGLIYASKFAQALLSLLLLQRYDNVQATFRVGSKKGGKDSWQERTVQRAWNAHLNHWEAFTGFAVAMILALIAVKDTTELTVLANAFILIRVAYNAAYILAFNAPLSMIRSAIFVAGMVILVKIFALGVPAILNHA